ncbi:hypothetical protein BDF14DRAFT_1759906 [Spinellus fusiger]|nr:hypothetical protein BDF14DRAFT_1759906 [Spinellus fusiger]
MASQVNSPQRNPTDKRHLQGVSHDMSMHSSTTTTTTTGASSTHENHALPTSPPFPPYYAHMDPSQLAAYEHNGYDANDPLHYAYVYPVSPQFSVQYYSDFNGYQSYPGSPALHPQSPQMNPQSPPFSPTYSYYPQGLTLSPPTHAYILPHAAQHFPPLHISPILTGSASVPGSPPSQPYVSLPGPFVEGRSLHKRHMTYPTQQEMEDDPSAQYHSLNIYVRGLSSTITDESFQALCESYGKVASSKAILDQKNGECKGYGFTMYEREQDCQAAIDGLNKAGLQASFARVGHESFSSRLKHLQDDTSTNIYISNLPLDMSEQKLEDLFKPCTTVSNRILRDPQTGISRGVGFARLTDRDSAATIIEKYNGFSVAGSSAPLQVRFADSPAQKKLKNQTTRKRIFRPREFQSMNGFPIRQMPITPETMLGIAPTPMASMSAYYQDPSSQYHPRPNKNTFVPKTVVSPADEKVVSTSMESMDITEKTITKENEV